MAKSSRRQTRKHRSGVVSTLFSPISELAKASGKVVDTGLNTVKGVSDTLVKGVTEAGNEIATGINRAVIAPFKGRRATRKGRKASRKGRKASRKSRKNMKGGRRNKASRKGRKASRKGRKTSRKHRKTSRKHRKASRKSRK